MKSIEPRPISPQESAVVRQALLVGSIKGAPVIEGAKVGSLRVIGICECGCASVQFECAPGENRQLADASGATQSGERVDIIIWGRNDEVSELEFVDHGGSGELPSRVMSWEAAGNAF